MPVEQQWQIGKWNISRLGGERDIYIYIYISLEHEIDGNNENFLTFWYRQTRFPPSAAYFE